jgi:hypothetical protein
MKTPMPVQLENWLNIVNNKRSPRDLRANAILHLTYIRDIIDESLKMDIKKDNFFKNENINIR